jgi:hypothetical protein
MLVIHWSQSGLMLTVPAPMPMLAAPAPMLRLMAPTLMPMRTALVLVLTTLFWQKEEYLLKYLSCYLGNTVKNYLK